MTVLVRLMVAVAVLSLAIDVARAEMRNHALLIANQNYAHWPDLKTAFSDVDALAEVLRERYDFNIPASNILKDATSRQIVDALDEFIEQLTDRDNLLIYYAGHGQIRGDRGYWIGVQADTRRRSDWLSDMELSQLLYELQARHVLVVADSCFSGALLRADGDVVDRIRAGEDRSAWLERIGGKRARTALTSGGLEPVVDRANEQQEHSVFAEVLLEVLQDNVEILEGQALYGAIKAPVTGRARRMGVNQTPEYGPVHTATHGGGDFLFVPKELGMMVALRPVERDTRLGTRGEEQAFVVRPTAPNPPQNIIRQPENEGCAEFVKGSELEKMCDFYERGVWKAALDIGNAYRTGLGVPLSYAAAARWYIRGAASGSEGAKDYLSFMLHQKEFKGVLSPQECQEVRRMFQGDEGWSAQKIRSNWNNICPDAH